MSLNTPHAVTSKELYSKMAMMYVASTSPKCVCVCAFLSKTSGVEMSKKSFYSAKLPERNMRVRASKLMPYALERQIWMILDVLDSSRGKSKESICFKEFY